MNVFENSNCLEVALNDSIKILDGLIFRLHLTNPTDIFDLIKLKNNLKTMIELNQSKIALASTADTDNNVNTVDDDTADTDNNVNTVDDDTADTDNNVNTVDDDTADTDNNVNTVDDDDISPSQSRFFPRSTFYRNVDNNNKTTSSVDNDDIADNNVDDNNINNNSDDDPNNSDISTDNILNFDMSDEDIEYLTQPPKPSDDIRNLPDDFESELTPEEQGVESNS